MSQPDTKQRTGVTLVDLEFGTGSTRVMSLGDIASTLVSLDELLRDLGSIAAYPASVEFRSIQVVAIETRSPLKVKLSLFAISAEAVKAFQDICRDIIVYRQRRHAASTPGERDALSLTRLAHITSTLALLWADGGPSRLTEKEARRISRHIEILQNADVPLTRVEVTAASS